MARDDCEVLAVYARVMESKTNEIVRIFPRTAVDYCNAQARTKIMAMLNFFRLSEKAIVTM